MHLNNIAVPTSASINARRGVGKTEWRRAIDELIASEKADIPDLATLRRLLHNNNEGLRLIAQLLERNALRVSALNELYQYKRKDTSKPEEEPLYPKG